MQHWQAANECAVQPHARDWLAGPRQYAPRFPTVGCSMQQWVSWPSREDWPRSTREARIQEPWRPSRGHPSYSFAGVPECECDVCEWANNEAPHSQIESNARREPRSRWQEHSDMRLHQRHWPESCTEELLASTRRQRWVAIPRSEWQSTRAPAVEQDSVVLRPDVDGESRFRNDSNVSAVERQRHERRQFSVRQDTGDRQAALGLPAWAIAPATSTGSDGDDDGSEGDETLPVRLSYEQGSDANDDDDESEDEDCDAHEFEPESKRQPRVSEPGKTKARAKRGATTTASRGLDVLASCKRKQAAGQWNNGDAGSSKRPKLNICRFDGGCHKLIHSHGLCVAHGGGKRCQYAGGCGTIARGSASYCVAHGGSRRCRYAGGCDKLIQTNGLCVRHGGGRRCQHADGCRKSAVSTSSYCRAHGGGKRCQYTGGCGKGAESPTSYCVAHGGGRRCQHAGGCGKCAQGTTSYCKAHGGGKRCEHAGGCEKSAQIPSSFCVAHGGGYRCQHAGGCNKHVVKKRLCRQHGKAAGVWD
jgi:hypothetical protein